MLLARRVNRARLLKSYDFTDRLLHSSMIYYSLRKSRLLNVLTYKGRLVENRISGRIDHSPVASLLKCSFLYSCAAVNKISTHLECDAVLYDH